MKGETFWGEIILGRNLTVSYGAAVPIKVIGFTRALVEFHENKQLPKGERNIKISRRKKDDDFLEQWQSVHLKTRIENPTISIQHHKREGHH